MATTNTLSRGVTGTIFIVGLALAFAGGFFTRSIVDGHGAKHAATQPAGAARQLWTCGMHPQVIQDHPGECPICHMDLTPLRPGGETTGGGVKIDPTIVQNMGVRTTPVVYGSIQRQIRVVGYLAEPEPLRRDINLRVRGWIEKLYADTDGMMVEKGKPLFDLYSPEIQVAVNELITARKSVEAAQGPAKQTAELLHNSTARKLELWGLEKGQIEALAKLDKAPDTVPILSPITGHVQEKKVNAGSGVEAGTMAMRLSNRQTMWVDAQVFEQQLPLVQVGMKAKVSVVAEPGRTIDGQVIFIHPHLDPQTRTATVRIEIPNEDHRLRHGMYATITLLSEPTLPAPVVPREAVIDTGTRQVVFVATGEGHFEPRQVKLGLASGDGVVQVLSGVSPNEQVVTSGQFLLDSESRLQEAIAKHLSEGLAGAPPPIDDHDHGPPATQPAPAPPLAIAGTDEMVAAYLEIVQALGAKQQSDSPLNVDRLLMAAQHALPMAGEGRPLVENIVAATRAMKGKSLADQRRAFLDVSNALIAVLDRSAPGTDVYVFHCPMAFDVENANWVQSTPQIANPYYATMMKNCGEVQRTIKAKK